MPVSRMKYSTRKACGTHPTRYTAWAFVVYIQDFGFDQDVNIFVTLKPLQCRLKGFHSKELSNVMFSPTAAKSLDVQV